MNSAATKGPINRSCDILLPFL